MSPDRPEELQPAVKNVLALGPKSFPDLPASRLSTMPQATSLLRHLCDILRPKELVVSSFGIREGLLYHDLDSKVRARDPLIEAARDAGRGLGRFNEHGALLDRWIGTIFDDQPWAARLRLAACMLADIAWQSHPDFRAERGVDMALHGNWVGIDGPGRVMVAQALFSNFGGAGSFGDYQVAALCSPDELERASAWGLAMRLAQRLSGGVATALENSQLSIRRGVLRLHLPHGDEALYGETVERRLRTLAQALGCRSEAIAA
jgi:exopolyphosphatase/guanosine-5'-triphosphate,3'-diphosphate pyrophosphatase